MKKYLNLLSMAAFLAVMPLAMTSCGDDDDKNEVLLTPSKAVSDLSFTDTDFEAGTIGGTLSWTLPNDENYIDDYIIYLGGSESDRAFKLGSVNKGTTSFDIPNGTTFQPYVLIVARNVVGESTNVAYLGINDQSGEPVVARSGYYVLNSGNWNENNSSLSFYNLTTGEMEHDVYKAANGKGLGDTAEQLLIYGSKTYITVSGSNRIAVLDRNAKELKSITPAEDEPMQPRCMAADGGKLYVSYYFGHCIAVLDTASLTVEKTIPVGRYPEQVAVANDKIYVANSGGYDFPNYGNTVSVIDKSTWEKKDIEVVSNPVKLEVDSDGDVYVISWADHGETTNHTLQRIDATSGEVTKMGDATDMALVDDELFTFFANWDSPAITYTKYSTKTEAVVSDNYLPGGESLSPSNSPALFVDPVSKAILMIEAPYGATSNLNIFTPDGLLDKTVETGGYAAKWVTRVSE